MSGCLPLCRWQSVSLPLRVGSTEGTDLIAHLPEERPDLFSVTAHPSVKLPLLDGVRPVQNLVQRPVDPEELVPVEVHE